MLFSGPKLKLKNESLLSEAPTPNVGKGLASSEFRVILVLYFRYETQALL